MLIHVLVALFIFVEVITTYKQLNKEIPWDSLIVVVIVAFIFPKIVMTLCIVGAIYNLATGVYDKDEETPE